MKIPVVILAGGLATRMRPMTEHIPKSMLTVAGEPFIAHQLRRLRDQGIKKVVMCLGYLGEQIEAFVKEGSEYSLEVVYSYDGKKLLGTGGAIKQAISHLADDFFVLYGDSWLDVDYSSVYQEYILQRKPALMTIYQNKGKWDTSNVEIREGKIHLYSKKIKNEKMTHIDYGLTIFSKTLFEDLPKDSKFDLSEVLEPLSRENNLASYEVFKRFYEIGSIDGLKELNRQISTEAQKK